MIAVGQHLLTFVLGANHSTNAHEVKQYVDALCAKPFRVLNLLEIVSALQAKKEMADKPHQRQKFYNSFST